MQIMTFKDSDDPDYVYYIFQVVKWSLTFVIILGSFLLYWTKDTTLMQWVIILNTVRYYITLDVDSKSQKLR